MWQGAVGTPLRAFVERLTLVGPEDCPWRAFLPALCRERSTCQEVLTRARADSARRLGELGEVSIIGRVWQLSRDVAGCRLVQSALDKAETDQQREALAAELRGHVWEALHCPHANHVLQKAVVVLRPEATRFVIEELLERPGGTVQASRHKYGCRVVQRLIEYCPPCQTRAMVELLLQDLMSVARHPYGTYVIQKVLQHGLDAHREFIIKALRSDIASFASDANASAVLGATIQHCEQHAEELATMIVQDGRLLVPMACSRLGHASIGHLLEALPPKMYEEALRQLARERSALSASRFGLQVLEELVQEHGFSK